MKLPPPNRNSAFARFLDKGDAATDADAKADIAELADHHARHAAKMAARYPEAKGAEEGHIDVQKLARGLVLIGEAIGGSATR